MRTSPLVTSSSPASRLSVVVLPQPDGPSSVTNSPSAMSRLTSAQAKTVPNRLLTPDQLHVRHQPLTAPSTNPWRMNRRNTIASTTTGMLASTADASICP